MKKLIGILLSFSIVCSSILGITTSISAESTGYIISFTDSDMAYSSTTNCFVSSADNSCCIYPGYGYSTTKAGTNVVSIRKFISPASGDFKVQWGTGVYIENGSGLFNNATVEFAITDKSGNILFPNNNNSATITAGTPLPVSLTVSNISVGDEFNFIIFNPSVENLPVVMNMGVYVSDTAYSNNSGFLYGDSTVQGTKGWRFTSSDDLVKEEKNEKDERIVTLEFTPTVMTYDAGNQYWTAGGESATLIQPAISYADSTVMATHRASIRKFVSPSAGTLKLDYGSIYILQNGYFTGASIEFAVTDKDGKIIYPTSGGTLKVTEGTPQTISANLGTINKDDEFYFIAFNSSTQGTPLVMNFAVIIDSATYTNSSGQLYGNSNVQGDNGWYYMYSDTVNKIKYKDYRDMSALKTKIAEIDNFLKTDTSIYTDASVNNLKNALNTAKQITKSNTQKEIDDSVSSLAVAFSSLDKKQTSDDDKIVALNFTEKEMTYDSGNLYWTAGGEAATLIQPAISYADSTAMSTHRASIRKFVAPISGNMRFDYGSIYILQNGYFNGATVKFAVTDKEGKIIFPSSGPLMVTEGTSQSITANIGTVSAGDEFYFITYDSSMQGTPLVMNFAVIVENTSYSNSSGQLYGSSNVQGDNGWYYLYSDSIEEIKAKDYRDISALKSKIDSIESFLEKDASKYTNESVSKLKDALKTAKAITRKNTQKEIDDAVENLDVLFKALEIKPIPYDEQIVALDFTVQEMTYDTSNQYWTAGGDLGTLIQPSISYSDSLDLQTHRAAARKFVAQESGDMRIDYGSVYVLENGYFNGATAEFAITDKHGKIIYPSSGGTLKITEGSPQTISQNLGTVSAGDEFYFIVLNPDMYMTPVVMNFAVIINNTSYSNQSGQLYGNDNVQGENGWYYMYADNIIQIMRKDFRDIYSLLEMIEKTEKRINEDLSFYTIDSVNNLKFALAEAKKITKENSQEEIDKALKKLNDAYKNLTLKNISGNARFVKFSEKLMQFDEQDCIWKADIDNKNSSCIIAPGYGYTEMFTGKSNTSIRKLVVYKSGKLVLKWGIGVYIDNSSNKFNDASCEFVITNKDGRIVFPQSGGSAVVKTDAQVPVDFEIENVKVGDEYYFITYNPSEEHLPVAMNFGVSVDGYALTNDSGQLYGYDEAQGACGWFYEYSDDLELLKNNPNSNSTEGDSAKGTGERSNHDKNRKSPKTGDADSNAFLIVCVSTLLCALALINKSRKRTGTNGYNKSFDDLCNKILKG